jgi:hypothetical protein
MFHKGQIWELIINLTISLPVETQERKKSGIVMHACGPNTQKAETGGLHFGG